MDQRSDPPEPAPRRWARAPVEWLAWFGVARVLSTAVGVAVVAVGAVWLLRSPPPDVASGLPMATTVTSVSELFTPTTTMPDRVAPETVVVHVTGAVRRSGVVELPAGARVSDAVAAAGGATRQADQSLLNLAAPLIDGSRIEVPRQGADRAVVELPAGVPGDKDGEVAPVDVNRASALQLEVLPGVGPATAAAIVTERETNGPFVSADDLERVPGIGPARLAALRDLVVT